MKIDFTKVTQLAGKAGLMLKKASPHIMLVSGVAGVVAATVLACRATVKAKDLIEETHDELDDVEVDALNRNLPEKYRKKAIFKVYVHQTAKFAKLYALPVTIGAASLGLIIGSHCVLNRRYVGTAAAYKAVDEAFKAYRKRIADIVGEEEEKDIYYGRETKEVQVPNEDPESEEAIITEKGVVLNPKYGCSPYARFFDEYSPEWKKNAQYNLMFLKSQEKYANNLLRANGHLFLNEVYDMLGLPRSSAGAVVGWLLGAGDDYVDFGIYNCFKESAREFVNGYERSILLDFNVDGVIYDKI